MTIRKANEIKKEIESREVEKKEAAKTAAREAENARILENFYQGQAKKIGVSLEYYKNVVLPKRARCSQMVKEINSKKFEKKFGFQLSSIATKELGFFVIAEHFEHGPVGYTGHCYTICQKVGSKIIEFYNCKSESSLGLPVREKKEFYRSLGLLSVFGNFGASKPY